MKLRGPTFLAFACLALTPLTGHAALTPYSQNFESLSASDPAALANDGWLVYGNVYSPERVFIYGYGPFPAPNGGSAFSDIDLNQGGVDQGAQQLVIYSDYNNTDHALGRWIEANVFHEQTVGADDVGDTWTFQFDAKLGNLLPPSTAQAFVKTLDPQAGYATTNFFFIDTHLLPTTWGTFTIPITIDAALVGKLLQFGFNATATNYQSSAVFYDNLSFQLTASAGVGDAPRVAGLALAPAAPTPFRHSTRLSFTLPVAGDADVSVYDVSGRRVASLFRGRADAGTNAVSWDGRLADGGLAPVGVYRAVLSTADGRQASRNLVLAR
jgi:hypothetical protein